MFSPCGISYSNSTPWLTRSLSPPPPELCGIGSSASHRASQDLPHFSKGLNLSSIKIGEISNFGFLPIFFRFVNMGSYGKKTSNDILSESAQQICFQQFMHTPRKGLYQSCKKNCEISNFGFFAIFLFFFFGRLT